MPRGTVIDSRTRNPLLKLCQPCATVRTKHTKKGGGPMRITFTAYASSFDARCDSTLYGCAR
jgi:hypothetical protein